MTLKLLTEHHLVFLSLKGGCTGSSESTHVKMPHCKKSRVTAHFIRYYHNALMFQLLIVIFIIQDHWKQGYWCLVPPNGLYIIYSFTRVIFSKSFFTMITFFGRFCLIFTDSSYWYRTLYTCCLNSFICSSMNFMKSFLFIVHETIFITIFFFPLSSTDTLFHCPNIISCGVLAFLFSKFESSTMNFWEFNRIQQNVKT